MGGAKEAGDEGKGRKSRENGIGGEFFSVIALAHLTLTSPSNPPAPHSSHRGEKRRRNGEENS